MKISAYIPCYNVEKYIEPTIQALLEQTRAPDEILIVDDGSKDRTVEVASRYPVRVIRHESNKGLSAGRNTAFANARYELVAAIDADVTPEKDWLERLSENFDDPGVAGAGGRLIEKHRDTLPDGWRAMHFSQDMGEERIEISGGSPRRLGGFGTIYRKDAVERVGGYDERYRTNFEDVDLCVRLLGAGFKLVFDPRAIAHHMRRDTISSILRTSWSWDFWLHYRDGGYNSIPLKVLLNFRHMRVLMWEHLKRGKPSFLAIDALCPWYQSYKDIRYGVSANRLPPVPDSSATDLYFPWPFRALRRRARAAQSHPSA